MHFPFRQVLHHSVISWFYLIVWWSLQQGNKNLFTRWPSDPWMTNAVPAGPLLELQCTLQIWLHSDVSLWHQSNTIHQFIRYWIDWIVDGSPSKKNADGEPSLNWTLVGRVVDGIPSNMDSSIDKNLKTANFNTWTLDFPPVNPGFFLVYCFAYIVYYPEWQKSRKKLNFLLIY